MGFTDLVSDLVGSMKKKMTLGNWGSHIEPINPVISKPNMYYKKDDLRETYILDVIVVEDHVRCRDEVKTSCPLKFDYKGITIFDPS